MIASSRLPLSYSALAFSKACSAEPAAACWLGLAVLGAYPAQVSNREQDASEERIFAVILLPFFLNCRAKSAAGSPVGISAMNNEKPAVALTTVAVVQSLACPIADFRARKLLQSAKF